MKRRRVWYYRPFKYMDWRWIHLGSAEPRNPADEDTKYQLTLVIGLPITGQIIIGLWECYD